MPNTFLMDKSGQKQDPKIFQRTKTRHIERKKKKIGVTSESLIEKTLKGNGAMPPMRRELRTHPAKSSIKVKRKVKIFSDMPSLENLPFMYPSLGNSWRKCHTNKMV